MIGALILYTALFRSRLIPRLISGWGVLSVIILGAAAVAFVFVEIPALWVVLLIGPLAIQEMVMALWFISGGFDADALAEQRFAA